LQAAKPPHTSTGVDPVRCVHVHAEKRQKKGI
jgi:hypothetical protein